MALFESYERKIDKINGVLAQYGISSVEECRTICEEKGFDPYSITKNIQPICFEDAAWAYTVGAAIAIRKGVKTAAEAAEAIGIGLQAFCIPGSVAEDRKVGLGHGNLGAMLLRDETKCFAFLAGHESFAAAKSPLESPGLPTGPGRSRCGSSSTVWARTPPRSSAGSTASPMCRLSLTTTPAP